MNYPRLWGIALPAILVGQLALTQSNRSTPPTTPAAARPVVGRSVVSTQRGIVAASHFGIMGGFNQPQTHAQFIAGIADYGFTIQEALEAGRFTKGTFQGCDAGAASLVGDKP